MNLDSDTPDHPEQDDDMQPEYDFSAMSGVRGKYYRAYREGHTVTIRQPDGSTTVTYYEPDSDAIVLDPDVRQYFPDAETVNTTLRSLIKLIPKQK